VLEDEREHPVPRGRYVLSLNVATAPDGWSTAFRKAGGSGQNARSNFLSEHAAGGDAAPTVASTGESVSKLSL